eukprot:GFKZ01011234.1.p2 GENE.GFKZ01011234.1~~GFKZ01011234.1.p2  ORF type:complete len:665 (-),score=62.31 GFKZ01011234.1:2993-4954(-)
MDATTLMDQTFLLPFEHLPKCTLQFPITPNAIPHQLDLPTTATLFRDCDIRYPDDSSPSSKTLQRQILTIGDHILLRPTDNSQRPNVAQVICFWSDKSKRKKDSFFRLKWFYRAEDLAVVPTHSIGEDEIFSTHHVDDCSVLCIAGRCLVQSYTQWLSTCAATAKPAPVTRPTDQLSPKYPSDSVSHVSSSFADNYLSSSLHFYVRRHFDPASDSLLPIHDAAWDHPDDAPVSDADDDFSLAPPALHESRSRSRANQAPRQRASHIALPAGLDRGANIQCRDSQKKQISDFLSSTLLHFDKGLSASNCLYISGVPGTGKTASVREVVHLFQKDHGPTLGLQVVEINAMCLSDSTSVYATLAKAGLQNASSIHRRQNTAHSPAAPETSIGLPRAREMRKRVLVILDEVDTLVTRSQSLLYDILDWSSTSSNIAVICISNSMNLPEKMLPRISSRLGVNRLSFPPYTAKELRTILANLLASHKSDFHEEAIRLCAARVGAISGDVRRAMEIMQLSAELCQTKHGPKSSVQAEIVDEAIQEMAEGCSIHSVEQTCRYERLVLCCSIMLQRDGVCAENLPLHQVLKKAQDEALRLGIKEPSPRQLEEACWMLSARNIISIENAEQITLFSLRFNLRSEDILFAFRNCEESKRILQLN